jgi:hypothetical protein
MFDDTGGGDDGGGFGSWFSRPHYYILDGHLPLPCGDFMRWAVWVARTNRRIATTKIRGLCVSTVFLGIDSGFRGPPLLFETMAFRSGRGGVQTRSSTWDEALSEHKRMVKAARYACRPRALASFDANERDAIRGAFRLDE